MSLLLLFTVNALGRDHKKLKGESGIAAVLDRNSRTGKLRQEDKKFKLDRETLPQSK